MGVVCLHLGFPDLAAPGVAAQDVSVSALVEPNPIGMDEQLSLIITVTGSSGANQPQIPKIDGVKMMGGPAVANQYQLVNGRSSSSQSFTYYFQPEREGNIKIPSISVKVGGKVYQTQEISVKVVKDTGGGQRNSPKRRSPFSIFDDMGLDEDSPFRDRTPRRADVLVVAETDKKSVSVGEQVTLTYKILTQLPLPRLNSKRTRP